MFTFGNSEGDLEMLRWTAAGRGPRFTGLVHHTDWEREVAYDRESHIGGLGRPLDEATSRGGRGRHEAGLGGRLSLGRDANSR